MSALRKVRLYGELGKKFGRVHHFAVKSPAEAIRALCANFPGFEQHMAEAHTRNVGYRVLHGRDVALETAEDAVNPVSGTIKIVPVVMGSKENNGLAQIIIGLALIAIAWYAAPSLMGAFAAKGAVGFAAQMGAALVLGGVIQMLSPPPKMNSQKDEKRQPSYVMDGTTNTMAQGHPVPLGYGRMVVGSAVISAGMSVDEIPITDDEEEETFERPDWTNPTTGVVEPMPAPTIVWNNAAEHWELPDGEVFVQNDITGVWELRGMTPTFNTGYDRWDVANGTGVTAVWDAETGKWRMTTVGGSWKGAELTYDAVDKRWEVQQWTYNYLVGDN